MSSSFIIAIDGPAASGKGTLARALSEKLGFGYMDTGALYRAVAYEVLEAGGNPESEGDAVQGAQRFTDRLKVESDILGHAGLRSESVAQAASQVASVSEVRDLLLQAQRSFAKDPGRGLKGAILDGRDIGTVVCPEAQIKIFITADLAVRAERRMKELQFRGIPVTYEAVLKDMRKRDVRDKNRNTAPLKPAEDAVVIDTSALTEQDIQKQVLDIIQEQFQVAH